MTQKNVVGIITTIQWNYDNKPTSITRDNITVSFTYDGNGQRVKKTAPNLTALYFGEGYEKRGSVGIIHLFTGNQRIASVRSDGTTQYYHPDHLGSSWIVTDGNGAIKEKNEFYPFGTYLDSFTSYPSYPPVNYTFTGQEEDDEVGFYNYNARLYDPVLGRFISPDSIVQAPEDPQSLNHYSYVRNNPLIYTDPTGNFDIGGFFSDAWDVVTGLLGFSSDSNSNSSLSGAHFDINFPWESSSKSSSNSFNGLTLDVNIPNLVDEANFFLNNLTLNVPFQFSYNPSKENTSGRGSLQIDYSKAFESINLNNFWDLLGLLRLPDYFSLNINVAIPTPWTATLLGWSGQVALDRYGNLYLGPLGATVGKSATFVSGSLTGGWLNQFSTPSEGKIMSFLSSNSFNVGGGYWGGAGLTWSPGNRTATEIGFVTPQGGGSYHYSWQKGNTGFQW